MDIQARDRTALVLSLIASALMGCADTPVAPEPTFSEAPGASHARVPAPLTATLAAFNTIQLAWTDDAGNESGWEVQRSINGPAGAFVVIASLGANSTSLADGGLAAMTQYCYRVRSFRSAPRRVTYGPYSTAACATTPVPAPSAVYATPYGSTVVNVQWRSSINPEGFRVERSLDAGSTWATVRTMGPQDRSTNDAPVASEVPVCYRVIAFSVGEYSPPSPVDCTTPPAAPSNVLLTVADGFTHITWTDNSSVEEGYVIWVMLNCTDPEEGTWEESLFFSVDRDITSYDVYGCVVSWAFVRAFKDGGHSDWGM